MTARTQSLPVVTHQTRTALLGMTIFCASWAMLFAALFFAYGVVRVNAHVWPPVDQPRLPLALPGLATLLLAGVSALLHLAPRTFRRGPGGIDDGIDGSIVDQTAGRRRALLVGGAALLGGAFLALQMQVWTTLFAAGLRPDTGTYASVFWGFTVFHALHVVVGLAGLAFLTVQVARAREGLGLRLWTLYFHLVGAVWALMYLTIYVL